MDGGERRIGERLSRTRLAMRPAARGIALYRGSARRVLGPIPLLNGCGSVFGPYIASASSQYAVRATARAPVPVRAWLVYRCESPEIAWTAADIPPTMRKAHLLTVPGIRKRKPGA